MTDLKSIPVGDLDTVVRWLVAWNDHYEVPEMARIMKLSEEVGEAVAEYTGYRGLNPRKGVTNGVNPLIKELLDVALAALVALATVAPELDIVDQLDDHAERVARRAHLVVVDA